jgi:hypothetical protein
VSDRPILTYASEDQYFFQRLLKAGAIPTETTLHILRSSSSGGETLPLLFDTFPELVKNYLLERKILCPVPILMEIIMFGSPTTVEAILEWIEEKKGMIDLGPGCIFSGVSNAQAETRQNLFTVLMHQSKVLSEEALKRQLNMRLFSACREGNFEAAQTLLDLYANPNYFWFTAEDNEEEYLSLIIALWMRQFKFVNNVNLNFGARPASEKWRFDQMRKLLLEYGLDETVVCGEQGRSAQEYYKHVTKG